MTYRKKVLLVTVPRVRISCVCDVRLRLRWGERNTCAGAGKEPPEIVEVGIVCVRYDLIDG